MLTVLLHAVRLAEAKPIETFERKVGRSDMVTETLPAQQCHIIAPNGTSTRFQQTDSSLRVVSFNQYSLAHLSRSPSFGV